MELKVRGWLESLLVARPRTKELFIGHPALMLAFALGLRGRRTWLPLAALLAAIGQISIVNTLCHFHIPLYLSLLRILHGFWMGALVGAITLLIWRALFDRRRPGAVPPPRLQPLPPGVPAGAEGSAQA
jgi:MFS family permease